MKQTTTRRTIFRKQLIMPTEHGTWFWLLVPFAVGVGIAGKVNLAVLLALIGGLSFFLMRQPATIWMRARQGRARKADGPVARGWVLALGGVSWLCLLGLLALGQITLLWLGGPLAIIFVLYLMASRYGRAGLRSLGMELAGAAALGGAAPAAAIAATGQWGGYEWGLWGLMAAQNVLGALYVRLRIFDTHQRPINRALIFWWHAIGLAGVVIAGLLGAAPLWAAIPFVGFLARAGWAAVRPRLVAKVSRFGFTEAGVEILSGATIVAGYWLG